MNNVRRRTIDSTFSRIIMLLLVRNGHKDGLLGLHGGLLLPKVVTENPREERRRRPFPVTSIKKEDVSKSLL